MITLTSVSKSFDGGRTFVVHDLSLHVHRGELLVILGESGSGKTTIIRMINRLAEPTHGRIFIDGIDISSANPVQLRRSIGYVFQGIGLFPHMTVGENIGAVPKLLGWNKARIASRVIELMEQVGLAPHQFRDRKPRELSGGQQQRIGVARALAAEPQVMLMDEPFGALDPITRATLQDEFQKLQRANRLTVILVTHDMTEALMLADRIAVMRRGKIVAVGTPHELLTQPKDEYVSLLMKTPLRQAENLRNIASGGGSDA